MVINFGMEIGRLIYKPKNKYRQYTETDFFTNLALALCLHDIGKMKSKFDKQGAYTGTPDEGRRPEQDADDL